MRIRPSDIKIDAGLMGVFGKTEREQVAEVLVRFCQSRKSFKPFRRSHLQKWLEDVGWEDIPSTGEADDVIYEAECMRWLSYNDRGLWALEKDFIEEAYNGAKRNEAEWLRRKK